jgi:hypothetical protein
MTLRVNVEFTYKASKLQVASDSASFNESYPSIVVYSVNKSDGKRWIEAVGLDVPASVIDEGRKIYPWKDYHFIDPFAIDSFAPWIGILVVDYFSYMVYTNIRSPWSQWLSFYKIDRFDIHLQIENYALVAKKLRAEFEAGVRKIGRFTVN